MAAPTLERLVVSIFAGMGNIDGLEDLPLDFDLAASGVVNHVYKQPIELAASASTNINLANIFEGVGLMAVQDVTAGGAGGMLVGGNTDKFTLTAGGIWVCTFNIATTPPTIYLTAPSGETKYLELYAIGKRA